MSSSKVSGIQSYSPARQILAMVLVYIAVLFIIMGFIRYAYCDWHRNNYYLLLEGYAREYLDGSTDSEGHNDRVYFFDREGNTVFSLNSDAFYIMTENPEDMARKYISKVFSGKKVSAFKWLVPKKQEFGLDSSVVFYGIPVTVDDEIKYACVMVKETPDTLEVTAGFIIIITIFFAILIIIIVADARRVKRYDAAQKQYIDNVTHELKSPVASVKALAQALSDGKTMAGLDNDFYYGKIMTEADKQEKLIGNILELSKIQNGTAVFNIREIRAEEVFRPVLEKYRGMCNLLDITFEIGDNINKLEKIHTDPTYFTQLLDILLSNAVKFADKENGAIRLDAETVKKKATISVTDNGIGISKEELPYIFDRFYRGKNAGGYAGSGLGLSMAREIVSGLKERIWIESEEGKGTSVFFTVNI